MERDAPGEEYVPPRALSSKLTWIQYDDFDVGKDETKFFRQDASWVTVIEVTGYKTSNIAGRLHVRDGCLVFINPNGVSFKDGSVLDGNIITSTLAFDRKAFEDQGQFLFEGVGFFGQKPRVSLGTVKGSGLSMFVAPWFESVGFFMGSLHVFSGKGVSLSLCSNRIVSAAVQGDEESLLHVAEGSVIEGPDVVLQAGNMQIEGSIKVTDETTKLGGKVKSTSILNPADGSFSNIPATSPGSFSIVGSKDAL